MNKLLITLLGVVTLSACTTLPTSSENLVRGDGYFKDGQYEKALKAYNRAIALNPENLEAYASRGSAHYFLGHYSLAQADFEHVLQQNPYSADSYSAYASALAAQEDYQDALKIIGMAIELQPNDPKNLFSRAGIYFMLGRLQEAVEDYTTILRVYPAADVYNARGAAYLYMNKKDLAEQDFEAAKQPGMPATLSVYNMAK